MTFAVHSIHAPAVKLHGTCMTHDGKTMIPLGEPLFTAETREEAEAWQAERLREKGDA